MNILVTGGAGYIGSHTSLELLQKGYSVTVLDNLSNSSCVALNRVRELSGKPINFIEGDILDSDKLDTIFSANSFDAVVHFAGLKAVGESVAKPLIYYENNVSGTINLLKAMHRSGVKTLVFSSSATVYGEPKILPIDENTACSATNPYGMTKLTIEMILKDIQSSDSTWRIACLRYFNPVGAHPSGLIGEDPRNMPNNLMPFISQVACGVREELSIFGGDYPTADGTGVRDYIHIMDLARGHTAAVRVLANMTEGRLITVNLGTGTGTSVLEMIAAFEKASGKIIPYKIVERRPGDVASCYADAKNAELILGWKAELGIEEMCADTWKWQSSNPLGY